MYPDVQGGEIVPRCPSAIAERARFTGSSGDRFPMSAREYYSRDHFSVASTLSDKGVNNRRSTSGGPCRLHALYTWGTSKARSAIALRTNHLLSLHDGNDHGYTTTAIDVVSRCIS